MNAIDIIVQEATLAFTDLVANPAASGKDLNLDISVCNKTGDTQLYSLQVVNEAETIVGRRTADREIDPNDTQDLWLGLLLPPGWKLQHRNAAEDAIDAIVSGAQIARLP